MKVSILASSSSGNSIYIEDGEFSCLVDAGLTGKKIIENLNKIDRDIKDIKHIFVTHEHIDHIKGVGVLARKYNIPVFANKLTWDNMSIGDIKTDLKFHFEKDEVRDIQGVTVSSFGVSHDAANPQFYTFERMGRKVSILTDTGYVSDKMIDNIKNSNTLIYESNHEENILLSCSYPWKTKQRILSDQGHLSNTDSANYLTRIIGDSTKNIFLAHLSKENNTKELASMTTRNILGEYGFDCEENLKILDTDPDEPTKIISV